MNEMHSLPWPGPKGHRSRFLERAGHLECAHGEVRACRVLRAEPLPAGPGHLTALPAVCSPPFSTIPPSQSTMLELSFTQQSVPRRRHIDKTINRQYRSPTS